MHHASVQPWKCRAYDKCQADDATENCKVKCAWSGAEWGRRDEAGPLQNRRTEKLGGWLMSRICCEEGTPRRSKEMITDRQNKISHTKVRQHWTPRTSCSTRDLLNMGRCFEDVQTAMGNFPHVESRVYHVTIIVRRAHHFTAH